MSIITIYHNPACGTSRNVLGLIRNSGEEPIIIEYLKTPPDRDTLKALIVRLPLGRGAGHRGRCVDRSAGDAAGGARGQPFTWLVRTPRYHSVIFKGIP